MHEVIEVFLNASMIILRASSYWVSSPNPIYVKKSEHRGKASTCEPQVITKIWFNLIISYLD